MIPKIIHYCWFGGNEKDLKTIECLKTWQQYLPDYEIKEWSEKDLEKVDNAYVKEAYQAKKWAFVSDYFRLYALYQEGGIYFDTDVEVKKSFNDLLELKFFIGSEKFGKSKQIGSAVIGAEKGSKIIEKLLSVYKDIHFIKQDGSLDVTPNTLRLIEPLKECGFEKVYTETEPIFLDNEHVIYPVDIFSLESEKSYAVHHFAGSWREPFTLKSKRQFSIFGNKISIYRFKINNKKAFRYPSLKKDILIDWDYKKKYKLLISKGNETAFNKPIDLVYLWVNGNDKVWEKQKQYWQKKEGLETVIAINPCRFIDNQELKYSLRSAQMYAPWIRKIFIVTNGQVPEWLDINHPKIQLVRHDEIMPKEALPTFNSSAIEVCLDNIPGLSEYFLYANDDMFFNKPVAPDYFFSETGRPRVYLKYHKEWDDEFLQNDWYCNKIHHAAKLIDNKFFKYESTHNICAYTKSNLTDCKHAFKELFDKTTLSRFRSFENIQRHIYDFWAIKNHRADGLFFKNKKKTKQLYLNIKNADYMNKKLKKYNPILVCYNDYENANPQDRDNLKDFLNKRYPFMQKWEIEF